MNTRGDHTASESNLSSSGYSSMASPGPSRCSSNNPLCPSEMEDPGPPGSGATRRRQSLTPVLKINLGTSDCDNIEKDHKNRGGDAQIPRHCLTIPSLNPMTKG
ncbi:hypothetical protein NQ317_004457 [Molorchus minor]|uniref:Uncharacterized protein n=1 Tax=Molorchus minor TaxID=1323400 RepID=A0ABQ9JKX1_9CUCU|nr:hypothetical protein NQ317_004457 [Molorchus minor]